MEMTNRHLMTLRIWRVFVIGNDETPTQLRDRVLRLVMDRVQGMEDVPREAILFRPRTKLMEVVEALPPEPDALFIVPDGTERLFPEVYDASVIRYRTEGTSRMGAIDLHWAPRDGASYLISHVDNTPVEDCQTSGLVRPHAIKDRGPPLPLRVMYQYPGQEETVREE